MFANPASPALALGLAVLLTTAGIGPMAQSSPPPVDPALRARFGFVGPLRHKIGDGLDLLQVRDLDGDGRAEIVVEYPQRGRLDVLSFDPDAAEGESIRSRSVDTGGVLAGVRLADIDGDGRPDLVTLTQAGRIAVLDRAAGAQPIRDVEVGAPGGNNSLRAGDLDGDGTEELVCLTQDGIRVVRDLAGTPQVGVALALGEDRPRSFLLTDVDGDDRLDVVLTTGDERMPLRIALGDGAGGFGSWLLFPLPRLGRAFAGAGFAGDPTLAIFRDARGRLVEHRVTRADAAGEARAVQFVAMPGVKRGAFPFAHADVDGDGAPDLVLAQPERAELTILLERDGSFEAETVPTLAGVSGLAAGDVDGDGRTDLLLASPEEKTLSWWSGAWPRDRFPERIVAGIEPVAVAVGPDAAILTLVKGRREGELHRIRWDGAGFSAPEQVAKIDRLSGEPQRLLCGEFDPTPGYDVAVVLPGDGLRVFRSDGNGGFTGIDSRDDGAAEIGPKVEDGAVAVVRHAAGDALLICRGRYARIVRLDATGQPLVLEQRNAPAGAEELTLGTLQAESAELFVDRKSGKLFRLQGTAAPEPVTLPALGATHVLDHGGDALVLGRTGVARVRFGAGWVIDEVRNHEPPTESTRYFLGLAADLDSDGAAELALADGDLHGVQVLVAAADSLQRALAMPVFEPADGSDEIWEPRMLAAGDVDGDGATDLVLVAFDRVLIYLQETR